MGVSHSDAEDRLHRATRALKAELPDEGPSEAALQRTAAALASAPSAPHELRWRRRTMILAGALAASLLVAMFWSGRGSSGLVFGDVLDRLREATQFSFQAETIWKSQPRGDHKTFIRISEPDRARSEFTGPQGTTVIIRNGLQTVLLNHARRSAVEQTLPKGAFRSEKAALDELQQAVQRDARSLGKKQLNGIQAEGFEAVINDRRFIVWADSKTGNPIRIEATPLGEMAKWMPVQVLSDFKFDQHFPDELFRLDIPEGYDVVENQGWQPIEEITRVLQAYADRHEGRFPAALSAADETLAAELGIPADRKARTADQRKLARSLDNARLVLTSYRANIDYRYLPGAKLGDAERPILWLAVPFVTGTFTPVVPGTQKMQKPELPKAADPDRKFDVLYADLHVEQRTQRDLPEVPADIDQE